MKDKLLLYYFKNVSDSFSYWYYVSNLIEAFSETSFLSVIIFLINLCICVIGIEKYIFKLKSDKFYRFSNPSPNYQAHSSPKIEILLIRILNYSRFLRDFIYLLNDINSLSPIFNNIYKKSFLWIITSFRKKI